MPRPRASCLDHGRELHKIICADFQSIKLKTKICASMIQSSVSKKMGQVVNGKGELRQYPSLVGRTQEVQSIQVSCQVSCGLFDFQKYPPSREIETSSIWKASVDCTNYPRNLTELLKSQGMRCPTDVNKSLSRNVGGHIGILQDAISLNLRSPNFDKVNHSLSR